MRHATLTAGLVGLALSLAAGSAFAAEMKYTAELSGASEVPAVETAAKGTVDATYDSDTKMLSWTIDYSGLSGDATASHFHGPAEAGSNAPPVVPVAVADIEKGSATLTEDQAKEFADGMIYFNIHTAAHPGGEIRGQLAAAK